MGTFNHQESNGLSAPPYALCFVTILACAFASDRAKLRGPFVAAAAIVSTVGYCLLGVSEGVAARYAGVFLSVQIFISISTLLPWVSSVHHTESKRAGGWAIFATLGQFGPLVGTNIFPKDQGPYYHKGAWISCGFTSLVVLLSITYSLLLRWENKRLDRVMIEDAGVGVGMEGDGHPRGFRFFNHYSELLPGILNENEVNCESYLKESSLLFWTIIATGSRRLEHATKLHRIAVQHIRGGTFQPLLHITNPIPIIKSSLILCLWPLPVDAMWKDPSHVYAGTAHSLAVQNGLFVNGHERDFARTHTSLSKEIRDIRAHLWFNCCLVFQALCDGLPYLSISESKPYQRKTRLEEIVDASFHYRIKCHDILIDATRAFGDIIDE
ncbi:hypothetical protein FOYG_06861 [Fusarium oxysporum NRRL 32931]|uniref:Major facilitator superfamily (MFS) profile domain-containing protein n=1 Tax=Fusarium oxysporum NRRL 32931 TaxID=660029 RepID=W9IN37_FUSOX|nr:hypothetical protein FOYG_06861 [Fusarium oxysporum NRRL 32931]